jgi:fumarate reductase subunit C
MNAPYVRSMRGWWRRDPFFVRYMAREATALAVAAYAIVLLTGVWRLAQGKAPFDAWLLALQSPLSIVLHLVLLAAMVYHSASWFAIMPKTMPMLFVRGQRVQAHTITRAGLGAVVLASVAVLALAWWLKP